MAHTQLSVRQLLQQHYQRYGRNFFTRYDYEEVDSAGANRMMQHLQQVLVDFNNREGGQDSDPKQQKQLGAFTVAACDDFSYVDPIDQSVSKNQVFLCLLSLIPLVF